MNPTLALPTPRSAPAIHSADALRKAVQSRSGRIALDATGLNRVLRYEEAPGLVEVQAGTAWSTLADHLSERHPELAAFRASRLLPATVGDWIAQNAPAPDGRPAVHFVEALTLVTLDAELKRVSRYGNPELFACAVGGHGVFGVPYSVTLRISELVSAAVTATRNPPGKRNTLPKPGGSLLKLLVPAAGVQDMIAEGREICADWRLEVRALRILYTSSECETLLRWANRDYAYATLDIRAAQTLGERVRIAQAKSALIDAAIRRAGSYAIADTPEASRAQAETCYPGLKNFLAQKRRYDPGERLQNPWYHHHRRLFFGTNCPVTWN